MSIFFLKGCIKIKSSHIGLQSKITYPQNIQRWMDGWIDGRTDGRTDEWMGGWVGKWVGGWMDGWMTCHFASFLTVFQSCQDDGQVIIKVCVQWNSIYDLKDHCLKLGAIPI